MNENIPAGIADFFKQTLSSGFEGRKNRVNITRTPYANLDLVTASAELSELQSKLESKFKINKLRKLLVALSEDYERIYIDTPPSLNFYTFSALVAADRLLIPFDCDRFSRQALYRVIAQVEELRLDHNESLTVEGVVVNQFTGHTGLHQMLVDELMAEGLPVLPVYLSSSVKMRESHEVSVPLVHFAPRHKLSLEFANLLDALERAA
jgi:chromosome partitioning protein